MKKFLTLMTLSLMLSACAANTGDGPNAPVDTFDADLSSLSLGDGNPDDNTDPGAQQQQQQQQQGTLPSLPLKLYVYSTNIRDSKCTDIQSDVVNTCVDAGYASFDRCDHFSGGTYVYCK